MSCQIWHVDGTQCLVKYGMLMELNVLSNMACLWNSMSCQIWHVDGNGVLSNMACLWNSMSCQIRHVDETQCLVKYGMLMEMMSCKIPLDRSLTICYRRRVLSYRTMRCLHHKYFSHYIPISI